MVRATPQVIAICLAVYVAQLAVAITQGDDPAIELFALSAPIAERPWTVVTSVYAHAGPWHLLSNVALLALVGLAVERRSTAIRFHAFVLLMGIAANASQVAVSSVFVDGVHVLGISGAVFALLGYVATGNRLTSTILDSLHVPRNLQLVVYLLLAVIVTVLTAEPGVALVGHFVGLFLGLVAGAGNVLRP